MNNELSEQEVKDLLRQIKNEEEIKGFKIHRTAYFCVMTMLIIINLAFVPGFTWFIFPFIGWGTGLMVHYLGIKDLKETNAKS